jgi:ABC-2 type transport system ATP-binding protein
VTILDPMMTGKGAGAVGSDGGQSATVTLRNVVKRYGDQVALDGFSLAVYPGEVVALLGPNGAGKTTAIRLMLGLTTPDAGSVELFGRDPSERAARQRVGAMLQVGASGVPGTLTVREHLNLFRAYHNRPLPISEIVRLAGIEGLENRRYGKLSGGEKQRVMLALALCGDPDLLFLDEPTVGMDVEARALLWNQVRSAADAGKAVLLTTHYLEEADRLADRILVVQGGRLIASGTPAAIKAAAMSRHVRCRTSLSDAAILVLPGVTHVVREGAMTAIASSDPDATIRALVNADPTAASIEVEQASLERAFLALTGAADRLDVQVKEQVF